MTAVVTIVRGEENLAGPVGDPVPVDWPMTAAELEDLRWYLEDYLLADFLAQVGAEGRSAILIISRTAESWLEDPNIHRIEIGGLPRQDAVVYADALLASSPAAAKHRRDRAFEEHFDACPHCVDRHPPSSRGLGLVERV
jgi:hypothetical protein